MVKILIKVLPIVAAELTALGMCMLKEKMGRSSARWLCRSTLALALLISPAPAFGFTLTTAEARSIGRKVWQNECDGTISGLTSWNAGEDFASLGIGHFIWYPEGRPGPFEESFPKLVSFVSNRGAKLPSALLGKGELHCPWNSRAEFLRAQQSADLKSLRQFLADTVDFQAQFLAQRLHDALPKMLAEAAPERRGQVEDQFRRVAASGNGRYALIDYVNFKGEGVLHTERYNGQGWGLLQVLEEMHADAEAPVKDFSRAAGAVLKRRIANSPPARGERRWLGGWINRVTSYSRE